MEFSGLVGAFPVNRPLTTKEHAQQLKQSTRLNMPPRDLLAVIKMNSTFLETVDKWFAWRGFTTSFALTVLTMFTLSMGYIGAHSLGQGLGLIATEEDRVFMTLFGGGFAVVLGLIWWAMVTLLKKESFRLTHYPVRFNRKTRMVHAFRVDGTVLSAAWDDIFFTIGGRGNECEVRGHVLGVDKTVLETFPLSYNGILGSELPDATGQYAYQDGVRSNWEFVRRYMEEGPRDLAPHVEHCMPVDGRKETAAGAALRVWANSAAIPLIFRLLSVPLDCWMIPGRWFANATCRIPQWPAEIEASCRVDPDDPYAIPANQFNDPRVIPPFLEHAKSRG